MLSCKELTLQEIEVEAQTLRVMSGFRVSSESARDRICNGQGWVSYAHCLRCKAFREAA